MALASATRRTTGGATIPAAVPLLAVLAADPAFACTFADPDLAIAQANHTAGLYWIATVVIGGLIVLADISRVRPSIEGVLSAAACLFHPSWTVAPTFRTDCRFLHVDLSLAILIAVAAMAAWRLYRAWKNRHQWDE